jgi:two-component system KDP operon response regulator KdpE
VSKILVVDDQEDIRLLLRIELSAEGHHISEAANGEEALAALTDDAPDLMLLDIMMPVLDGWEVLRRLDGEGPPVVVITGMASSDDRHRTELLELGALDVIAKPFDPGWLLRLVDAVLLVDPAERDEYRRRRINQAQREG